MNQINLYRN